LPKFDCYNLPGCPPAIQAAGWKLTNDQTEAASDTVAQFLGIPFITVCCALAINPETQLPRSLLLDYQHTWVGITNQVAYYLLDRNSQPIQQVLNHYRRQWKLPVYNSFSVSCSRLAQISQQPADFGFPVRLCQSASHYLVDGFL